MCEALLVHFEAADTCRGNMELCEILFLLSMFGRGNERGEGLEGLEGGTELL